MRAHRHLRPRFRDTFSLSGWLFADIMLGLALLAFAAATIGPGRSDGAATPMAASPVLTIVSLGATPTATATVTLTPTPTPEMVEKDRLTEAEKKIEALTARIQELERQIQDQEIVIEAYRDTFGPPPASPDGWTPSPPTATATPTPEGGLVPRTELEDAERVIEALKLKIEELQATIEEQLREIEAFRAENEELRELLGSLTPTITPTDAPTEPPTGTPEPTRTPKPTRTPTATEAVCVRSASISPEYVRVPANTPEAVRAAFADHQDRGKLGVVLVWGVAGDPGSGVLLADRTLATLRDVYPDLFAPFTETRTLWDGRNISADNPIGSVRFEAFFVVQTCE